MHLEGIQLVFLPYHLITVVDLVKQIRVVDAEDLVLKESRVHLLVLFLACRDLWSLVLVSLLTQLVCLRLRLIGL